MLQAVAPRGNQNGICFMNRVDGLFKAKNADEKQITLYPLAVIGNNAPLHPPTETETERNWA